MKSEPSFDLEQRPQKSPNLKRKRSNAKRIEPAVFDRLGLVLLGVDSKGSVHQVYPTYYF